MYSVQYFCFSVYNAHYDQKTTKFNEDYGNREWKYVHQLFIKVVCQSSTKIP